MRHPRRQLCARRRLHGAQQLFDEHDFPSGSETRRKGRPVITSRTSPSPKAITFSLTKDRVSGKIALATETIFPGSGRHVTRPSGRVSCFWARDSSQITLSIPRRVGPEVNSRRSDLPLEFGCLPEQHLADQTQGCFARGKAA